MNGLNWVLLLKQLMGRVVLSRLCAANRGFRLKANDGSLLYRGHRYIGVWALLGYELFDGMCLECYFDDG